MLGMRRQPRDRRREQPRGSRRDQRREPRREAGWFGTYSLPKKPDRTLGECRILDLSASGAGLELYGPWPRKGVDTAIIVRLGRADEGEEVHELLAEVRNATRTKFGFMRVGVRFVGLTPDEARYLRQLTQQSGARH